MAGRLAFYRFKSHCSSVTPAMKLQSYSPAMNVTNRANHSLARPTFGFVNSGYCGKCSKTQKIMPFVFRSSIGNGNIVNCTKKDWQLGDFAILFEGLLNKYTMMKPTSIVAKIWQGVIIVLIGWFLHPQKTDWIRQLMILAGINTRSTLILNVISSIGLFIVVAMILGNLCGVGLRSVLTINGIGGVVTAFAVRDIIENVLNGFYIQMSSPFLIGDTIQAGSIEGQVVEMGLTTTTLLSAEKFRVIIPNSLFSNHVIMIKSNGKFVFSSPVHL